MTVQVFGVGVAIAILLDALIVRPVLLPAAVALLGPLELVAAVAAGATAPVADAADPDGADRDVRFLPAGAGGGVVPHRRRAI